MSSEIFEYLFANRHEKLNNDETAKVVAKFMEKHHLHKPYDFQSSIRIHVGTVPNDGLLIKFFDTTHLLIITDYKLFVAIVIGFAFCRIKNHGEDVYCAGNSWLFTCDENTANEAIEYFSNCNYVFNYDHAIEKTKLVPVGDGTSNNTTFADFIPRMVKSNHTSTESNY